MTSRVPTPPSRRRFDRVGGGVLAVIGIVVAVVAVIALQHPNGRQAKPVSLRTSTSTVTATATTTTTKTPPPSHPTTSTGSSSGTSASSSSANHPIPLVVLNSTTVQDLAQTAKQQFQSGGWTVTSTGNLVNDIISTCAYYDPSDPANQQAATQLQQQFPSIKRVMERFPELPPGPIVVVLTSDYS